MTLLDVLDAHARDRGDQKALSFFGDGENETARVSYGSLRSKALSIAARLEGQARALLLCVPGLEFVEAFFGCLYGGVVAVPTYPPDPLRLDRSLKRLRGIVADAAPSCVLTSSVLFAHKNALCEAEPALALIPWFNVDDIAADIRDRARLVGADSLALLQYTSGSTREPRGVMVSHGNILHNCQYTYRVEGNERQGTTSLTWLPSYHDMGLIEGLLQPLFGGFLGYVMPTHAFIEKPMRWIHAMSKLRATNTGGPNFAYELCARRATAADLAELSLGHWRVAYNGSEPIRASTYQRFTEVFGQCGFSKTSFRPVYGLAEATLVVTSNLPDEPFVAADVSSEALARGMAQPPRDGEQVKTLVGVGKTREGMHAKIVEHGEALADNHVGEIWLSGPSVTSGYFQRDNTELFHAQLAGSDARWLRTGDLGFLREGELFVTGRIKDVIIVSGRNVYPQDLEAAAESAHPAVRRGAVAAFGYERGETEAIGLVCEIDQTKAADLAALGETLRAELAKILDASVSGFVFLARGELPKTSSGKLQRHAAKALFLTPDAPCLWREERQPEALALPQGKSVLVGAPLPAFADTLGARASLRFMESSMSHAELTERAEQAASALEALGISAGDVVGVCSEPCLDYVITMLACFKLGAVYFPIDPEAPAAFTRMLLGRAAPKIVLRHTPSTQHFPPEQLTSSLTALVAMHAPAVSRPLPRAEQIAWLGFSFTGSAGPARLELTHAQILAAAHAMMSTPRDDDVWMSRSNLASVDAVSEVLSGLIAGVPVYIASREDRRCPAYLVHYMGVQGVTRFTSSATLRALIETVIDKEKPMPGIREYQILDDDASPELRDLLRAKLPNASGVFLGGADGQTAWRASADEEDFEPLPGVTIEVRTPDGVAPIGMYGKLYINGQASHRTGRVNERGRLELSGYDDPRERVQGVELNPEWVTFALRTFDGVLDAFTRCSRDRLGEQRVLCYVVAPGLPAAALRDHIKELLPDCFWPQSLVLVPRLYRSATDEVDESRLPPPPWDDGNERPYAPPRTPTELALADLFKRVLQVRRVGRGDDFFELGGDSLLAMHVAFYAEQQGLPLTTRLLGEMKTLAKTAAALDALTGERK